MSLRLTVRLTAVLMLIVGAVAVPSAASAISFQCGPWETNGSFQHRGCIDDTAQGDMWHEIQIKNTSTTTRSVVWSISYYSDGITYPCGTYTSSIGAGQTIKRYCVSVRYVDAYYRTAAKTTVGTKTVVAYSPLVYIG